jgi:hypothetical protein
MNTKLQETIARINEKANAEIANAQARKDFYITKLAQAEVLLPTLQSFFKKYGIAVEGFSSAMMTGMDDIVKEDTKMRVGLKATTSRQYATRLKGQAKAEEMRKAAAEAGLSLSVNGCCLYADGNGNTVLIDIWL